MCAQKVRHYPQPLWSSDALPTAIYSSSSRLGALFLGHFHTSLQRAEAAAESKAGRYSKAAGIAATQQAAEPALRDLLWFHSFSVALSPVLRISGSLI